MPIPPLMRVELPGIPAQRGKVRDMFDFGERLLIVATDRISAFDWVLPNGIPEKGQILTEISRMWFERLGTPHHLLDTDPTVLPLPPGTDPTPLVGRSIVVRKARVIPVECVARGYLAGSGWREYQRSGTVCGQSLPPGLEQAAPLPETIFTPTTKADSGHDLPITFDEVVRQTGVARARQLRETTIALYQAAASFAKSRGLILADTKFEFGETEDGQLILVDEVLTPDSSRYWPADSYRPGMSPPSFDKQFVRDWLDQTPWDKASPPPALPEEIVTQTQQKYRQARQMLLNSNL